MRDAKRGADGMGAGVCAATQGERRVAGLRFRLFPPARVAMPVHPHFADLLVLGLAEDRASGVHRLPGAAAAEGAAEFGGEPRPRLVDLPRLEAHLGLM